jgi:ubiquinone/menaquinone biosynthesis C-methylase UbiE
MKRIEDQTDHAALIKGGHDDRSRQEFAFAFRNFVTSELMPSNRTVFDRRAAKRFKATTGKAPESPRDIRAAMDADSYYTFYLSARRSSQELIWRSVIPAVEQAADALPAQLADLPALGSLTLEPDFKAPRYIDAIDIHCMPGGYTADAGSDDLTIGAIYDRGVYLYMSGLMGGLNDAVGQLAAHYIKRRFPGFAPRQILDMGCSVGHSTLPYVDAYPEAEVHALDAGAALLRYGHARARSLGKAVHFRQANAEATPYADGSFDLVTSHIMLHETSTKALPRIFAESYRLLRPGGLMVHIDQPSFRYNDAYQTFLQENETHYNNEPFWITYRSLDLPQMAAAAGFGEAAVDTDVLTAAVVQQSQNNEKVAAESAEARKRGFQVILGWKGQMPS